MNKFTLYSIGAALILGASACSEDYLELAPQSSVVKTQLFATPDAAQYAINGIGRQMVTQYLSEQGYNGEGTIQLYYGEYPGADFTKKNLTGWSNTMNANYHERDNTIYAEYPWYYYYKIIGNANQILENIPEDADKDWKYIEAQALVLRAYSYMQISRIYCRRWVDRNGESRGLPIRLEPSTDPLPASTLKQVYEQIYADLDKAIADFQASGKDRGDDLANRWLINENVAHAVYSRAALWRQDFQTCITQSQLARKGCKLMGTEEYYAGFNTPNKEWIWMAFNDETQDIYYYSFFSYASSNGSSSSSRSYPPGVSRNLVEQIPANDTRLAIICIPTADELEEVAKNYNDAKITKGNFYKRIKADFANRLFSTTTIFYYIDTKFQVGSGIGIGNVCLFRAAEMIYNEAESQQALGNDAAARALLEEAVTPYQAGYSCSLTGDKLRDEIRLYRRFDLRGEGHNWFDFKRWNIGMVRNTWQDGGNWNSAMCGDGTNGGKGGNYGPTDKNRWTFIYPKDETQYNELVSTNEPDDWTPTK